MSVGRKEMEGERKRARERKVRVLNVKENGIGGENVKENERRDPERQSKRQRIRRKAIKDQEHGKSIKSNENKNKNTQK